MKEQTQHILSAADSAHQGIELARSLLQESLGSMGEILTQGCAKLGEASLGSTMRLGQKLKVGRFILDELLEEAHGLCVLLGHDLGICEDRSLTLGDMVGEPHGTPDYRDLMDVLDSDDLENSFLASDDLNRVVADLYERELKPGEDEFDDDEQPF